MKRILAPLLFLTSFSLVQAQTSQNNAGASEHNQSGSSNLKLGFSIIPGITVGRADSKFILGGELSLYKTLTPNLESIISAGYTKFFYSHEIEKEKLIPIKAGLRFYLNSRLYLGMQAGVALSTTDGGAYFIYSPTIGLKMNKQLEVGFRYDHISNKPSVFGLASTYKFGL